jgi:hypothetical protein
MPHVNTSVACCPKIEILERTSRMSPKALIRAFEEWCGREDLNLHGIAPASTSSQKPLYRWVS